MIEYLKRFWTAWSFYLHGGLCPNLLEFERYYRVAKARRWMGVLAKKHGWSKYPAKWTKERCRAEAGKYKRLVDWKRGSQSSYKRALLKGWSSQIYLQHFQPLQKGRER